MQPRLTRLRAARSAGAATLEYVVAIALACVIMSSVVVTLSGSKLDAVAAQAICRVKASLSGGGGCSTTPPTQNPTDPPFNPKPSKCKMNEHSEKVNSEIKIAFIKFGENAGFVQTTYSDGTVTYTATDGASVGVTGGVGAKFDVGKLEAGAKVDFGAGVKVDYGSTWTFKNADEAKKMRDQLDQYLVEQETLKHDTSGGYALWLAIHGATDPPKPPNQSVSTIEVNADVTGKLGLSLPFDTDKNAAEKSGVPNFELGEAGSKFGGNNKWTIVTDTEAGTKTYTTSGENFGQVNGGIGPISGELKGIAGSSIAITRDKNDNIVKVTLVTTREGKATGTLSGGQANAGGKGTDSDSSGNLTVTTTSLDVKDDQQRALVNQWLQAQENGGLVSPETFFPDRLVSGDPFQNLLYTNGTVSNVEYKNVSDKTGFAAEVKLGVALGIDLSLETADSTAVDATYLDTPGTDGVRPPVTFSECLAQ